VVEAALERLYERHPDWPTRFGARGKEFCRADLHYHQEYLRACLETQYVEPFLEYARWIASVLESKGMAGEHLAESFDLLEQAWQDVLAGPDMESVSRVLHGGKMALASPAPYKPAFYKYVAQMEPATQNYTDAILAGDRVSARSLLFKSLSQGVPLVDVGVGLVQPAMYEVGQRWQESRVSIAQEHLATAISQSLLAQAYAAVDPAEPIGRKAMFACVEGNHHSLGLRMLSDAFELEGWDIQFLGADTPSRSLVQQVDQFRPEILCLSVSLTQQTVTARKLIQELRGDFKSKPPVIMLGGLATNHVEELWRAVGADLWSSDARSALGEVS
jgi:methanogenic corrinoid protein MtbC1